MESMCASSTQREEEQVAGMAVRIWQRSQHTLLEIPIEIDQNGGIGWREDLYGRTLQLSHTDLTALGTSIQWALHSAVGSGTFPTAASLRLYAESLDASQDAITTMLYCLSTCVGLTTLLASGNYNEVLSGWAELLEPEPPSPMSQNMRVKKLARDTISTVPLGRPAVTQPPSPKGKRAGSSTKRGKKRPAARKKKKKKTSRKASRAKG